MALPATDNFNRSDGALGANWTDGHVDLEIDTNTVVPSGNYGTEFWNADAFDNDQYSEVTITAVHSLQKAGPGVRISWDGQTDAYIFIVGSGSSYLGKVVNNSYSQIGSAGGGHSANDVLRLEVSGTTLDPKVNGTTESSIGQQTDATLGSGSAGLGGYGSGTSCRIDNWEGGDLAAAGANNVVLNII